MKKIFAVVVVFGFVVGFAGCGTEDDPTLGIDEQEGVSYNQDALIVNHCAVATNGTLTGKCLNQTKCDLPVTSSSCPAGAVAFQAVLTCGRMYRVDNGRSCP